MKGIITQEYIVLYAGEYEITNETTGKVENEGVTLLYLPQEDLTPCADMLSRSPNKGVRPAKANLPRELMHKVEVAPALYEVSLRMVTNSKLQPIMKVVDMKLIGELSADLIDEK